MGPGEFRVALPHLLSPSESQVLDLGQGGSECSEGTTESLGLDSIPPPPTLHFALASITPLSRILAQPQAYLQGHHAPLGYGARTAAAAGLTGGKVNLLVVIKEVGEVSYVNAKYPTDSVANAAKRARTDGAAGVGFDLHSGKTERVELVVMDGRPDGGQGGRGEKYFFKVILWGSLARGWVVGGDDDSASIGYADVSKPRGRRWNGDADGDEDDSRRRWQRRRDASGRSALDDTTNAPQSYGSSLGTDADSNWSDRSLDSLVGMLRSTDPRPLRAGDVIALQRVSIVNSPASASGAATGIGAAALTSRRNRLGSGFPRRASPAGAAAAAAAAAATTAPLSLVAHGSERNSTSIELCYRSVVADPRRDGRANFDPDVARFDNKSRRVYELHVLWRQGEGVERDD
ncbi:uncharacterized protein PFL1_05003 [Pseudozyma flocculosa PF-1]|uniref:Uncharacterized protein n=1 Tax=Pseudozyma flocculosa PF-1 TaxID=1277687 RepID=A0A061H635_9BASI|nr:uncharacterized protein PFL1_05003 [Pseudozyma flocculosa PF-1]EPQ27465.1 hypothetical protein PFL1_05003 [Pseudozyma flocculosa PF-1]